ncbi:MAG: ABC transporter permease [Campylobacteraceae bacterium]|jgi:capsular polysaccharide transport system permease protein|nr:ABC transporter permease [Campylobacteraceae bacterium]
MRQNIKRISPFRQFISVIFALFLREIKTRFGGRRFGVFWTFVEPAVHLVIMLFVFSFLRARMMPQVPFELFLLTGIVPFFLFRHIATGLMSSISANKALFAYAPVKPIDTYITRTILESVIYTVVFAVILFVFGFWGGFDVSVTNPFGAAALYFLLILFGFSFGIIASIASTIFPSVKILMNIILLPLYFLSAIMYPLWIVPAQYIEYLKFNPILHLLELFKANFFSYYPLVEGINLYYPLGFELVLLFIALALYRIKRLDLAAKS